MFWLHNEVNLKQQLEVNVQEKMIKERGEVPGQVLKRKLNLFRNSKNRLYTTFYCILQSLFLPLSFSLIAV